MNLIILMDKVESDSVEDVEDSTEEKTSKGLSDIS